MPALRFRSQENIGATLAKEQLVTDMRAWPHPEIATATFGLVTEVDGREQGEGQRLGLAGDAVTVDMTAPRFVVPAVDARRHLNVVEGKIDRERRNEFASQCEYP